MADALIFTERKPVHLLTEEEKFKLACAAGVPVKSEFKDGKVIWTTALCSIYDDGTGYRVAYFKE